MTTSQLEGTWHTLKEKLKQHYGQLTDDDLIFAEGKGEELLSRLQVRLGISREELDSTLDNLASTAQATLEQVRDKAAEISDQVRTKAADAVDDLKQRTTAVGAEARIQGAAAYNEVRQRTRGLWEDGEEYVRINPRESVLVAMAAGICRGPHFIPALISACGHTPYNGETFEPSSRWSLESFARAGIVSFRPS
jgi:uncharacterized protein YjbJ (UPF0337 family)